MDVSDQQLAGDESAPAGPGTGVTRPIPGRSVLYPFDGPERRPEWPLYDDTQDMLRQLQRDMEAYRFAYNYVLAIMERYVKWGKPVNAAWVLKQMQKAFNEAREFGIPLEPQESSPPTE